MSKSLMQALMAMHAEFGVILEKDKKGNRGTYTSLPGVLGQIHHMTKKHGLILTQKPWVKDGVQMLWTLLEHPASGQNTFAESILTPAASNPSPDQAYGSSMTYHRRYDAMALCGLFCDEDPSDHDGWGDHGTREKMGDDAAFRLNNIKVPEIDLSRPVTINEKQQGLLNFKLKGKDELRAQLIGAYGSLDKIPANKMNPILERIQSGE